MPTGSRSTQAQGEVEAKVVAAIRSTLAERAVTQSAVAEAAGMSEAQLSRILSGVKTARFSEIAALCDALGLRLSDVVRAVE